MKCITYVSSVTASKNGVAVPTGLSQILRTAQKRNEASGITGILSYRNGHYIQVIEGDDDAVDLLFAKIKTDPRHHQIDVLINVTINKRAFPNWGMKLLDSVNRDVYFVKLMERHSDRIRLLPKNKRDVLARFYKAGPSNGVPQSYHGKALKLIAWPEFTVLKQSPTIIELCARLTQHEIAYEELLESNDFGTQDQLDRILKKFETLGILKTVQSTTQGTKEFHVPKANNFYSKMRDFLRLG